MKRLMLPALAAALAACGPAAPSNQAGNAAVETDADLPRNGRYEVTITAEMFAPGVPSRSEVDKEALCLAVDPARPERLIIENTDDLCSSADIGFQSGEIGGQMVCDVPEMDSNAVPVDVRGSYSPDSLDVTLELQAKDGGLRVTRSYRRTGNC